MLTSKDAYKRLKFARRMKRISSYFWKSYISFFFDVASFAHKINPYDQARAVKLRAWRRGSEGLVLHLKSKGKKAGVQGKVVHFLWLPHTRRELYAMIIYRKTKWYFFASYIRKSFPKHFQASANPKAIRPLQDDDPSQNSAVAQKAMSDVGTLLLRIPTCAPDLNPIKNILNMPAKF